MALSGGVDSGLAAARLKAEGYRLFGLFMDLGFGQAAALASAQAVANHLGLELMVIDLAEDFQAKVVEPFLDAYSRGLTPNPCVCCNQEIKFKALLARALALGADRLATGHYCRLVEGPKGLELHRGLE